MMDNAIQEIFQEYGPGYIETYGDRMPGNHRKVINAICGCRTGHFGFAAYKCEKCGSMHHSPLSCGNRHCPTCQYLKTFQWTERQLKNKLPIHYFFATFTLPKEIRDFFRANQKKAYDAFFKSTSDSIKTLAADPRHIGGDVPGFLGVLHTWGRQMPYHPHLHYGFPGGAISSKDGRWISTSPGFYLPVRALSIVFKAKFRDIMKEKGLYDQIPKKVWKMDWNVNIQAIGRADAIGYLSRYVFKVAISNHRITEVKDGKVTFRYKKPKSNRVRHMTLNAHEFIRRFLQHVLPKGFRKIRYYGFMHPCSKYKNTVKSLIGLSVGFDVEDAGEEPNIQRE